MPWWYTRNYIPTFIERLTYTNDVTQSTLQEYRYIDEIINKLVFGYRNRGPQKTPAGKQSMPNCVVCSSDAKRHQTQYQCSLCKVALCPFPSCMMRFHTIQLSPWKTLAETSQIIIRPQSRLWLTHEVLPVETFQVNSQEIKNQQFRISALILNLFCQLGM